jgi:hypothetical protein
MHKSSFFFPRTLRTTLARPGKLHMSRVTKHQRITWWERIDTSTWLTLLPCIMRGRLLTVRSSLPLKLLALHFQKWPTGPFFCARERSLHTKTVKPSHDEGRGAHASKHARVSLSPTRSDTQYPSLVPSRFRNLKTARLWPRQRESCNTRVTLWKWREPRSSRYCGSRATPWG